MYLQVKLCTIFVGWSSVFVLVFFDDGDDGVFVADDDDELLLVDALDGGEDPELEVGDNGEGPGSHHWAGSSIRPETR